MLVRLDYFVLSSVSIQSSGLTLVSQSDIHLDAHFSHHMSRFSFVLVSLNLSLTLLSVVLKSLISLGEGMMINITSLWITETTEIRLRSANFFNFDVHSFDLKVRNIVTYLIILHPNFDGELVWHDKSISLNGVINMFLLLLLSVLHLLHLLFLELLLVGVNETTLTVIILLIRDLVSFHNLL